MDLAEPLPAYSPVSVTNELRKFFKIMREQVPGRTQQDVANAAGQPKLQGSISRIEGDLTYDPFTSTFLKAIRGLGMTYSDFFLKFETWEASGGSRSEPTPQRAARGRKPLQSATTAADTTEDMLLSAANTFSDAIQRLIDAREQSAAVQGPSAKAIDERQASMDEASRVLRKQTREAKESQDRRGAKSKRKRGK